MPRIGMEGERRKTLIDATISAIHDRGFFEVTLAEIARRAGVSSGLALHYFGSKDQLLAATMRHMLKDLQDGIRDELKRAHTPRARVSAIIAGNFSAEQFRDATIAAWLAFYVQSRSHAGNRRLLQIYARRLASNLAHNLKSFMAAPAARKVAEGTASMIDGVWIRQSLREGKTDRLAAIAMVEEYVETQIAIHRATALTPPQP
ncbi:transcriptional regulator BetI [Roseibium aestuarii]|uniref:HTH-type transcriptional regulator BetI n=1 Tax=Roseibium aestuarii TaxID=2600299 RepID=A0ABW4JTI0_9HYPH|nr:transcriptional regulator BetI [Roseibium aestuarii]